MKVCRNRQRRVSLVFRSTGEIDELIYQDFIIANYMLLVRLNCRNRNIDGNSKKRDKDG
jgi:hypothetical protein